MSAQHRSKVKDPEPEHFITTEGGLPVVVLNIAELSSSSSYTSFLQFSGFKNVMLTDKPALYDVYRMFSKTQFVQVCSAIASVPLVSERIPLYGNNAIYNQELSAALKAVVTPWGIAHTDSTDSILMIGFYNSEALLRYYDTCVLVHPKRSLEDAVETSMKKPKSI